jgi:hypothetical protein
MTQSIAIMFMEFGKGKNYVFCAMHGNVKLAPLDSLKPEIPILVNVLVANGKAVNK